MVKSMRKAVAGALLVLALALAMPACAQYFPMSYGFPNAVQTSTTTAWQHDDFNAFDFDDASVMPCGYGFPAIHQTSIHTRSASHTEFSQTTEFAAIGYPCISMGPGPMGGFACGY